MAVPIPEDVALFLETGRLLAASSENAAALEAVLSLPTQPAEGLPIVDASCPSCGAPMTFSVGRLGYTKERCLNCNTESVANAGGTARIFVAGLHALGPRREAIHEAAAAQHREEAEREAKLRELERGIAAIETMEAHIRANRPKLLPVLVRFILIFCGIALFCYVGYRIDVATSKHER